MELLKLNLRNECWFIIFYKLFFILELVFNMIIVIMFKEYGKYVIIVEKFYVKFRDKILF